MDLYRDAMSVWRVSRRPTSWKERIMPLPSLLDEPGRVDEPQAAQEYADVLSRVAAAGHPVIVRRNGEDLAAVIPLEYLDLVREALSRLEVEKAAAEIDWTVTPATRRPPQSWFDDDDNPFEPDADSVS
jgi:PHD/YefM family antitoxin component YafN of YafNO toxin-antitoxin module